GTSLSTRVGSAERLHTWPFRPRPDEFPGAALRLSADPGALAVAALDAQWPAPRDTSRAGQTPCSNRPKAIAPFAPSGAAPASACSLRFSLAMGFLASVRPHGWHASPRRAPRGRP